MQSYLVKVSGQFGKKSRRRRSSTVAVFVVQAENTRDAEEQALGECDEHGMLNCEITEIHTETGIDMVALPPQCPKA